jgi:hypothetical protein
MEQRSSEGAGVEEPPFAFVQGVSPQLANVTWFRGEHCNFNPTKADLQQPDAIDRHILAGWLPPAPFLTKAHGITAFGSCFAVHISEHLTARSYRVLTDKKQLDLFSYVIRCGEGIVNTFAIRQQFEWAFEGARFDENLWYDSKGVLAAYNEDIRRETRGIFEATDVFIITVGLAEIWYSKVNGDVFWRSIPVDRFDPERHGFRLSTVTENTENLLAIRRIIREHRPDASIIFTLSPIPLVATFRPVSCISANAVSKATLRVALDELMRAHPEDRKLYYFPAYEIVREFFRDPYTDDNRHVKPEIVQAVMAAFERAYCAAG